MLLQEAIVQLKAGAAMYRQDWDPQDGYIVLMPGMSHVWKIVLSPAPNAGNYIFSLADLESDKWLPYVQPVDVIDIELAA